jgi:hypothetical protein
MRLAAGFPPRRSGDRARVKSLTATSKKQADGQFQRRWNPFLLPEGCDDDVGTECICSKWICKMYKSKAISVTGR